MLGSSQRDDARIHAHNVAEASASCSSVAICFDAALSGYAATALLARLCVQLTLCWKDNVDEVEVGQHFLTLDKPRRNGRQRSVLAHTEIRGHQGVALIAAYPRCALCTMSNSFPHWPRDGHTKVMRARQKGSWHHLTNRFLFF